MRAFGWVVLFISICLLALPVAAAERMAVQSEVANVRSDPGKTGDVLWQMERYYPVIITKKQKPWYRFKDFDGHQGWVHSSLLDSTKTVVVRVRLANIRKGPGTQHAILFDAEKGTPFKVLGDNPDGWIQIQHSDGDIGWVFKSLVW